MTEPDKPADGLPASSHALAIRTRHDGRGVVCEVAGEVDLVTADQFRTGLTQALEDKPAVVVVDLTGLTFLGSVGLSVLIETNTAAGPGVLRIVAGNREPRRAIEIMGLHQVLTIRATVDEALSVNA